jgi:membrane protein CcdC involved in cytochrome C biogenesis
LGRGVEHENDARQSTAARSLIRVAMSKVVERLWPLTPTGALFFLLAFGAIVRWRISLLLEYRRLERAS